MERLAKMQWHISSVLLIYLLNKKKEMGWVFKAVKYVTLFRYYKLQDFWYKAYFMV